MIRGCSAAGGAARLSVRRLDEEEERAFEEQQLEGAQHVRGGGGEQGAGVERLSHPEQLLLPQGARRGEGAVQLLQAAVTQLLLAPAREERRRVRREPCMQQAVQRHQAQRHHRDLHRRLATAAATAAAAAADCARGGTTGAADAGHAVELRCRLALCGSAALIALSGVDSEREEDEPPWMPAAPLGQRQLSQLREAGERPGAHCVRRVHAAQRAAARAPLTADHRHGDERHGRRLVRVRVSVRAR